MPATTANAAEFQAAGKPIARPTYLVDQYGNPITSSNPLLVGTPTGGVLSIQGVVSGTPVPISGTVSAANPSVGLTESAIPASATLLGANDSTGNLDELMLESDANPNLRVALFTGTNQVSVSAGGALKVDNSAVTQPVSGTITANAGTGTMTVAQATGSNLHTVLDSGSTTIATQATGTNLHTVVDSGTLTANVGTTNGIALDTSVNGVIVSQGSATSGEKGPLIQGAVTTGAPTYTTAQTSPLSLTTAGAVRVDATATTQPVSGTITANQGGTWTVQPGNTPNTTAWLVHADNVGQSATPIAAGTAANTVIKASAGRLARVLVSTVGTNEMDIYDNSTTNSGTKIGVIPANAAVGSVYDFQFPAAAGITVAGNAANPAVTISWT